MSKVIKELKGLKKGYKAIVKNKKYNFGEGKHSYEVIELSGPKMDRPRIFVDEESVRMFVNANEDETQLTKAFTNAVKRASTKGERKEMQAAKELSELVPDIESMVNEHFKKENSARPEDTDK